MLRHVSAVHEMGIVKPQDGQWRSFNPYNGLAAMGADTSGYFFGRESITAEIIKRLNTRTDQLQMLVGNSGVGKSSVVYSGVIPALKMQICPDDPDIAWHPALADSKSMLFLTMKPGAHPVKTLALTFARNWIEGHGAAEAEALNWVQNFQNGSSIGDIVGVALQEVAASHNDVGPARIFLYIDQAEEIYLQASPSEAALFSALIAAVVRDPRVLIMGSLRSDAYGRFQNDTPLFSVGDTLDVPKMSRADLEEVIRKPSAQLGVTFGSPEAPAALAAATSQESGGLPLMSFLLSEAWEKMQADESGVLKLPVSDIDITLPLIQRAERFLAVCGMPDALERLFTLRLAVVDTFGEPARRRAVEAECTPEEWRLAQRLCQAEWRILTATEEQGEPAVQVAHETLLRRWPRLNGWIEQEAAFLAWRARAEQRASEWEQAPAAQQSEALLMGMELANARQWSADRKSDIAARLHDFISASIARDDSARHEAEERRSALAAERERSRRRAIWISRLSVAAALIFLAMGVFGWRLTLQEQAARAIAQTALEEAERATAEAERQAQIAQSEADLAMALNLASAADRTLRSNTGETAAAAMIALESIERKPTPGALNVLRRALQFKGGEDPLAGAPWLGTAAMAADGSVMAWWRTDSAGIDNNDHTKAFHTRVALLESNDFSDIMTGDVAGGAKPVLSPDGRTVFLAGETRALHITGTEVWAPHSTQMSPFHLETILSRDGKTLVTVREDGLIEVRAAPDWQAKRQIRFTTAGFDADFAIAMTGDTLAILESTFTESNLTFVSLGTGRAVYAQIETDPLKRHTEQGQPRKIAARNGRFVTSHDDETVRFWNPDTGLAIATERFDSANFHAATPAISSLDLIAVAPASFLRSENGKDIYETRIAIWDPRTKEVFKGWAYPGLVRSLAFSDDGNRLVASGSAGVQIRAVEGGDVVHALTDERVTALAFDSPQTIVVTTASEQLLRLSVADGQVLSKRVFDQRVGTVAVDKVGHRIAITLGSGPSIYNWTDVVTVDSATGQRLAHWSRNGGVGSIGVMLSPDGRFAAAQNVKTKEITVRSTRTGAVVKRFTTDGFLRGFGASSDHILSDDQKLQIYDRDTGRHLVDMGEPGGVYKINLAPSGDTVVGADLDGTAALWNLATGEEIRGLRRSLAWSPDGAYSVAHVAETGRLEVFRTATGEVVFSVASPALTFAAISPGGKRVWAGQDPFRIGTDGPLSKHNVVVWDTGTGQQVWSTELQTMRPPTVLAHDNGAFSMEGSGQTENGFLDQWLLYFPANATTPWKAKSKIQSNVTHIDSDKEGRFVALWTGDGLQLRNAKDGSEVWERKKDYRDNYPFENVTFLPGADLMVIRKTVTAPPYKSAMRLIKTTTKTTIWEQNFEGAIRRFVTSEDGTRGAIQVSFGESGAVVFINMKDGSETGRIPLPEPPEDIWFMQDGKHLATWSYSSSIDVWNIATGEIVRRGALTVVSSGEAHAAKAMRSVTLQGARLQLWNTSDMTQSAQAELRGDISTLAISPDGTQVAAFARDRLFGSSVVIWRPDAAEPIRQIPAENVAGLTFSPDSQFIAIRERGFSVGINNTTEISMRLVKLKDLTVTHRFGALPSGRLVQSDFSGDGRFLVVVENASFKGRGVEVRPNMMRAFDLETGEEVARRPLSASRVHIVPGTPDVIYRDDRLKIRRLSLPGVQIDPLLAPGGWKFQSNQSNDSVLVTHAQDLIQSIDIVKGSAVTLNAQDGARREIASTLSGDGALALLSLIKADQAASKDGIIELRDAKTGALRAGPMVRDRVFEGVWLTGRGTAFLSENLGILSNSKKTAKELLWWNWKSGEMRVLLDDNPISYGAVSADGSLFAAMQGAPDSDGKSIGTPRITVHDTTTGDVLHTVPARHASYKLGFSDDNRYLAATDRFDQFIYDLQTKEVVFARGRHPAAGIALEAADHVDLGNPLFPRYRPVFIPGTHKFVLVTDRSILVHGLDDGSFVRLEEANTIKSFDVSQDGRHAVVAAGAINVWNLQSQDRVLSAPLVGLRSAGFAGPKDQLIAAGKRGIVRILWQLEDVQAQAC
ncbi:MAG: WD40 repeat domain-containing protein, partial [Pseudomonadota bacterium]